MKYVFKHIRMIVLGVALVTVLGYSCTPMSTINKDSNEISTVPCLTMLNPVLYDIALQRAQFFYKITSNLMQVTVSMDPATQGFERHSFAPEDGDQIFAAYYRHINTLAEMERLALAQNNLNGLGVIYTIRAFIYSDLADIFGDVPCSEAGKIKQGILRPKYDNQLDVYKYAISQLDSAMNLYGSGTLTESDIVFSGKVSAWQKFTNSLRLKLLMKLIDLQTEDGAWARAKLVGLLNNMTFEPFLALNTENATVPFSIYGLTLPFERIADYAFKKNSAMCRFVADTLIQASDERLEIWFTPSTEGVYTSFKSAFPIDSMSQKRLMSYAGWDPYVKRAVPLLTVNPVNRTGVLMLASEVQFLLAEACSRRLMDVTKTSKYYYAGLDLAMQYAMMGRDYVSPGEAGFKTNPKLRWNNSKNRLMMQKLISNFFSGADIWVDYRRTKRPEIPQASAGAYADGITDIPHRLLYPSTERRYNAANVENAAQAIGGDLISTKTPVENSWAASAW